VICGCVPIPRPWDDDPSSPSPTADFFLEFGRGVGSSQDGLFRRLFCPFTSSEGASPEENSLSQFGPLLILPAPATSRVLLPSLAGSFSEVPSSLPKTDSVLSTPSTAGSVPDFPNVGVPGK